MERRSTYPLDGKRTHQLLHTREAGRAFSAQSHTDQAREPRRLRASAAGETLRLFLDGRAAARFRVRAEQPLRVDAEWCNLTVDDNITVYSSTHRPPDQSRRSCWSDRTPCPNNSRSNPERG